MSTFFTFVILVALVVGGAWAYYKFGGKKQVAPLATAKTMASKKHEAVKTVKDKNRDTPRVVKAIPLGRVLDERGVPGEWLLSAAEGTTGIVVGPTGSGKSQSIVIPVILRHQGPLLATSTKDELARLGFWASLDRGTVQVLDPAGVTEHGTDTNVRSCVRAWTPLQGCETFDEASRTVSQLVTASGNAHSGENQIWTTAAKSLLTSVLWLLRQYPGTSLDDTSRLLTALSSPERDEDSEDVPTGLPTTLDEAVVWIDSHPANGWAAAAELARSMVGRGQDDALDLRRAAAGFEAMNHISDGPTTSASVVFSVQGQLSMLVNAESVWFSRWDDEGLIDLKAWAAEEAGSLYVIAPDNAEPYLGYFCAFVTSAMAALDEETWKYADRKLPREAMLMLDELANICPLPQLPRWLATKRSQNIGFILGLQGLNQLHGLWSESDAVTIVNNANRFLMALPGVQDDKTTEHISRYAGEFKEKTETVSTSKTTGTSKGRGDSNSDSTSDSKTTNKNVSVAYRKLVTPDSLFQMKGSQAAVLIPRQPFALIETVHARKDKRLRSLMEPDATERQRIVAKAEQRVKDETFKQFKEIEGQRVSTPKLAKPVDNSADFFPEAAD